MIFRLTAKLVFKLNLVKKQKFKLVFSSHRLSRFNDYFKQINNFLNGLDYLLIAVPYKRKEIKNGKKHFYEVMQFQNDILKISENNSWVEKGIN